jgi:hypothetical protein
MTFADVNERFSSRAGDYIRYLPGCPPEGLPLLRTEGGLTPGQVADIGSGTGFLRVFLENGNRVCVIANDAIGEAGEEYPAPCSRASNNSFAPAKRMATFACTTPRSSGRLANPS